MNTKPIDAAFISLRGCHPAIRAVGYAMLAIFLFVLPVSADTVDFQQDVAGYTGAVDTFLQSDPANASTDNSASVFIGWDTDDPAGTGGDVLSLIRFDGIFGPGAGQVPNTAGIITSATLYLAVFDIGDNGEVREALVPWLDTNTFSSLCGTSCDQGVDYGPQVSSAAAGAVSEISINVTTSVQSWLDGATNNGWFITPEEGGNGGVDARSSEYATLAQRPRLEVVYDEGPPVSGNLIREPYLTLATPTSQTICWRSDVVSDGRVQYGSVPGSLTINVDDVAVSADHCVNITGLTEATKYWYNVGSTVAVEGGGSAEHYFWTHPTVGSNAPFTFWAVGDGGNGTPDQISVMDAMVTENGGVSPDLAIYLGDIAYNSGTDAEFTNNYFAPYAPVIRNMVVWPTLGNHEGASTTSGDPGPSTGPYYDSFVMPASAEAGGLASGTEAYYSFDYGNVHFISLNSYEVSRAPGGPMDTWLFNDLAATTQQWVVAYWHHPPYSKGTHNSDTEGELIDMRENLLPTLEAGGVDLVLCGHSHTYERSYLIDGTYSTPTPAFATLEAQGHIVDDGDGRPTGDGAYLKSPGPNAHEGTVYVVAGHGGQPVAGSRSHPVMFFGENVKGSVLVDVEENSLTVRNVRITGVVSDDFMIQKGELPPRVTSTIPAKEAVLGALPSIQVTFTAAVTGVDAADLTVNGSVATNVTGTGVGPYVFTGYVGPGDGPVNVNLAAGGIVDAADPALLFAGDSWSYTIDTTPPEIASETPQRGTSNGVLPSVTVNFTKPVFDVSADDLLVNSSPATTLVGIDGTSGPYIFTGFSEPDQGLVTVELLQDGIQDDQALLFAGDTWNYLLETRLVINEFLASNNTIIADEGGGFDDYFEIHNPGNSPISMGGMYLTNELDDPTRYEIPAGVLIPAGGYLLFWCDRNSAAGPLHTNFDLDKDALTNQDIGLFDTEANGFAIIDGLTYTLQTSDISSGRFPDATNGIVTMPPTPEATNTINCSVPADCSALTGVCTVGDCAGGLCVAVATNEGGTCEDGISCTSGETCSAGDCTGGTSDCPAGEICNVVIDVCEAQVGPAVGDLIISGFQASTNATEWFELFNTTDQPISLANMNIVTRFDLPLAAPDGTLDVHWDMTADNSGLDLSGLSIAPYSFFQVQEGAGGDLSLPTVDLPTGEMGIGELTLSIELTLSGVHMDYVLYGNNGDQTAAPPIAPGDVAWNGTSSPRHEVIRSVTDTADFNEGATWRATAADLHAGYDALGFYSDDPELGVWSSDHSTTQTTGPRNSSSDAVPPPPQMTCALSSPTVGPGGSVDLEVLLSSPDGDVDMNAFQTQILITQTSGTGSMDVPCPGGVLVDEGRPDYVFFNEASAFSATTCSLQRASGNLLVGSKSVGVTPVYLSEYTLEVALGTTAGSTFEISFISSPGSRLFNGSSEELPLNFGPVCTLTVQGCGLDSDCNDGELCTTDVCNAGTCENTVLDCSAFDDQCNLGVCNPGTGSCETQPANEGLTCDDLDACTLDDTCDSGVCVGGPPLDCNDANLCTNEACVAGTCVYSPSGICSIEGEITYYREFNNDNGFEPSAKGVPNVDIDVNQDSLADVTSAAGGGFLVVPSDLSVVVEPLDKLGATTISDHNNAISGTDASVIASFSVGLGDPSDLQLVAADVSGDGEPSAFDAARVAQFSVGLLPTAHFQVALDNQSDWAFFRCDNYVDQTNQDCGPPSYTHDPLTASEVDDNFYALLYGDVSGNWEPAGGPAPPQGGESSQSLPETAAGLGAQEFRVDLGDADTASRLALLRQMPGGELRPDIFFELVPTTVEVVDGVRRQTYLLVMQHADGLQGLDLEIEYNSSQVEIVDVRKGDAAGGFGLLSNGLQGAHKIGLFGVLPLQGTGTLLELTVETRLRVDGAEPFRITARANEKPVPVRVQGEKRELGSARR